MLGQPAGRLSVCSKNFHVEIFPNTINRINVKLLNIVVTLTELYPFVPLLVTVIVFHGHSGVKHFWLKISYFYQVKLKLLYDYWLHQVDYEHTTTFDFRTCSRKIIDILPRFQKKKKSFISFGFFSDTIEARAFKLCMTITLLGVYNVILSLMTLTLSQGHRCVGNINFKSHVLDSCHL